MYFPGLILMLLLNYLKKIDLPNKVIIAKGDVGKAFLQENCLNFWQAINHVHKLPYSRTTTRENYLQVLTEKKGVCSVKHALIAALAQELNISLDLTLGIFFLKANNMPGITPILKKYQLDAIPESHTYLKYNDKTLDFTFADSTNFAFDVQLEQELKISPEQIGAFKVATHQAFIKNWIKNQPGLSFDTIWQAREEWIGLLSQQ